MSDRNADAVVAMLSASGAAAPERCAACTSRTLHILNGDSTRVSLAESGVAGTMATWADVLHDGPVPPDALGSAGWRSVRARFIAEQGWATFEEALARYAEWDAALERYAEHDEVVIWCEHDLYDQLLLIRHLAWLGERMDSRGERAADGTPRLSLICIGEWPGRPEFKGLGELSPAELASLECTRRQISTGELALGRHAWSAFTSPDPRRIERFISDEDTSSLPFLAPALRRHLEDFPALRDGLARTERSVLELLVDGERRLDDLLQAHNARDRVFYLGDLSFIARVRRLASGERTLIALDPPSSERWSSTIASLTPIGREVLGDRADRVRVLGVDEWRGGVHLRGRDVVWRWDDGARELHRA